MSRTPLAKFIDARLIERDQTAEEFAVRVGISPSGLYKFLRGASGTPRHPTLEKIAIGLGMRSAAELLTFTSEPVDEDPLERGVRERLPQMRETLDGIPRVYWGTVISKIFDRAIDTARDMAQLLADSGAGDGTDVTKPASARVTQPKTSGNGVEVGQDGHLPICEMGSSFVTTRRMPALASLG